MEELNFSRDEQQRVWRLLVAILDLGNLDFNDKEREENLSSPCRIINSDIVVAVAETLGVSE
jgi:myosin heavy subunit